ncbi:GntR family transcriptional regulator [Streptomyces sp. NPDC005962]|uniref:GntR family transcriptional regulator n=1 Tax=Streptomyces sp. NPDC005962 TaxID=3154466 RepID=UPI0033D500F3
MPSNSADALQPHQPLYRQLAGILAAAIAAGEEYPPGSRLPSETELEDRYSVSRSTVRQAVAELRRMGLAVSKHGKGTYVREQATPVATIKRTLIRRGKNLIMGHQLDEAEEATVTRDHVSGDIEALFARGPVHALTTDRLLTDPKTGVRATHRTIIPFDIADEVPALADQPNASPTDLYGILAESGLTLTWWETVDARTARPDERAALRMADDADTILITHRVTEDQDGRALLVEEMRTSPARVRLAYRITPTTPKRG